nr:hypothetical protein [Tanacetum cinerariifolium]
MRSVAAAKSGVSQPVAPTTAEQRLARKNELKAREEEPANFALMALLSSSSSDNETGLESVKARLLVYKQNESVFEENFKLLNIEVQLRDIASVTLRQKLEKAEQERDDLTLKLEKFQTSSKNLTDLLASQTNKKTRLRYNSQVFTKAMFDCENYYSLKSDCESWPPSNLYDRFQPSGAYHLSPTKPEQNLSHTSRPSAPIIEDWVSYSDEEFKPKDPQQYVLSFAQSFKHVKTPRHSVQPIETTIPAATPVPASPKSNSSGQRRNRKACFVCKSVDHLIKDCDFHAKNMAKPTQRNHAHRGYHKQYAPLPHPKPLKHNTPTAVLTQSKPVSNTAVRPVSAVLPYIPVTRPRHANQVVTKSKSPIRWQLTRNPSSRTSNSPPRVNIQVSDGLGLKKNLTIQSVCRELNGGYVAFGCNPKGGKITGKGKIKTGKLDFDNVYFVKELKFNLFSVSQMCDKKNSVLFTDTECLVLSSDFKLPDESQVLLRVPRENNMYNVNLKNIVPSGDLTCLFAKATLDESNLWHRRLAHVNFKTLNKLVNGTGPTWLFDIDSLSGTMNYHPVTAGNQTNSGEGFQDNLDAEKAGEEVDLSYMLFLVWSSVGSTNPCNNVEDATFDGKEHDFDVKKPESKIIFSPSYSAQSKEQDDKTMKEAKGKSHVESIIGYRDLNAEFQDCSENSSNEVTTASSTVPTIGQNSINNTNTFSAAGLSNTAVSPTYGDASQFPDDLDMPGLEDIIYSDDEDVVGAEANFNNLESSIPVSPIPTTSTHKYHPISQIIGDLSSTTQIRSMTRAVKDQGGLSQMFGNDFHTCMFACFLSQEEPKRVYRNKKDERGIVIRNKARLVAQGHTQEEGIDYEEVFALVARIKAIQLFLAYASFMGFMVFQMDVKSAFLYDTIEEEMYVCQPPGFEDPDHPDKVYKVVKALYGLHQAPRAWYETLATYLLENGFQKGTIDQTLFIKKQKVHILLVQIYVDDIIFSATNRDLCRSFEKMMKDKFQMSSMGKLTFFLDL